MSDGTIALHFGLEPGRYADAAIAAESLIAWVDTARDAARAIDPQHGIRVELIRSEMGSLRHWLRLVEDQASAISEGADEFPHLKKVAIGLAVAVATAGIGVGIERMIGDGVQTVELSEVDRQRLDTMVDRVRNDAATSKSAERFYQSVEKDPAVTDVMILDDVQRTPLVMVPRRDFALRGGLWAPEQTEAPEEQRCEQWTVVLAQAPFYNSHRHWAFLRDGVRFSAQMHDAMFLQAITDRTIPITLQEGVTMIVDVEWIERLNGQVWEYVPDSRKITRVISPRPVISSASGADHPEENDQP